MGLAICGTEKIGTRVDFSTTSKVPTLCSSARSVRLAQTEEFSMSYQLNIAKIQRYL